MQKIILLLVTLSVCASSCANLKEYDAVQRAASGEYLVNQSALRALEIGMTLDQVHEIMGEQLIVGYNLDRTHQKYTPRVIANPIKTEILSTASGEYFVEYYVTSTVNSNDAITNDKLTAIYFKDGKLVIKPRE